MIELWDTSALILAARDATAQAGLAEALANDEVAICEPIQLEYLNGARNAGEYDRFDEAIRAARLLSTNPEDWQRALAVHRMLAESGPGHQRSVRLVDLIVAAVGERHGYPIAHVDHDYDRIAKLTGQAVRWVLRDARSKLNAIQGAYGTRTEPEPDIDQMLDEIEQGYRNGEPRAGDALA